MSDLVSVVRSLPEALWCEEHWCAIRPNDPIRDNCPIWSWEEEYRPTPVPCRIVPFPLAGLFAECPNCDGDGWLMPEGFEKGDYDARAFDEGVDCPSCRGGVVIKPDIIVRMATEIPTVHSTPADCEYWYDRCNCNQIIAERALWAVFGDECGATSVVPVEGTHDYEEETHV